MVLRILLMIVLMTGFAFAQRGGGGSVGDSSGLNVVALPSVLDKMETACKLTKDQKKEFKTILDTASKSAETLRKQIPENLTLIGKAAVSGKSTDEVKKLVDENGRMRAQISEMEYKTFGQLYKLLDDGQRMGTGAQSLFNLTTGILMKKKWND
jgi:hypothetical protein